MGFIIIILLFSQNISLFFFVSDNPVADPGEGPGGAEPLPWFLDQIEARRAEKIFFFFTCQMVILKPRLSR